MMDRAGLVNYSMIKDHIKRYAFHASTIDFKRKDFKHRSHKESLK